MDEDRISIRGLGILFIVLIIVSIFSFILSSIEGFLTGVVVIFIGFLLSFFRDDIKSFLGISKEKAKPAPIEIKKDDPITYIEKGIAKGRKKLTKAIVKNESEYSPEKKKKRSQDIFFEASTLLTVLNQAKGYAIQKGNPELVRHYEELIREVEAQRDAAAQQLNMDE